MNNIDEQPLADRLRIRATIRRGITTRKSVQNGEPDRLSDLLEEAANEIADLQEQVATLTCDVDYLQNEKEYLIKLLW